MPVIDFKHKMAAHCETGTVNALLNYHGLSITEPMVFGIAGGIFFGYLTTSNFAFPTFIVRSRPGQVRKNISKRLGVQFNQQDFGKNREKGEQALDQNIEKGIPTAAQLDFFYMDYMPEWQRVHINVHFLIVIGKEDDHYIVSDSYFPKIAKVHKNQFIRARFAGGHMAPKGFIYTVGKIPKKVDFKEPIIKGIKRAAFNMVKLPVPFVGVKGIYKFASKINEWPKIARDEDDLSHQIMKINVLLEDQGTGGAGFRYMYATFLQQAADELNDDKLNDFSKRMMEIGDGWRHISYHSAKMGKNRAFSDQSFDELSKMIKERGDVEKVFFTDLLKHINTY